VGVIKKSRSSSSGLYHQVQVAVVHHRVRIACITKFGLLVSPSHLQVASLVRVFTKHRYNLCSSSTPSTNTDCLHLQVGPVFHQELWQISIAFVRLINVFLEYQFWLLSTASCHAFNADLLHQRLALLSVLILFNKFLPFS
jgi:hypothetical protein